MIKTNIYKIEQLGQQWHLFNLHYKGWFIFKTKVWTSEFPYSTNRDDIVDIFAKKLKVNKNIKLR